MLKLTLENLSKLKLLPEEKLALQKLIKLADQKGYTLFLFGSRTKGRGADIDIVVKSKNEINLKDIIELDTEFMKYCDTKLDLIPYNEKTKYFINKL